MRRTRSGFVLAALWAASSAASAAVPIVLECGSPPAAVALQDGVAIVRSGAAGAGALLTIEEDGVALEATSDAALRKLPVPPRLGLIAALANAPVEIALEASDGRRNGTALATLECDAARAQSAWRWMEQADALAASLTRGTGGTAFETLAGPLAALAEAAYDPRSAAWAIHLRAQGLLMAGRTQEASETFLLAERAWRALPDARRADAALVAALEDMNRAAAFAKVLEAVEVALAADAEAAGYYRVRLRNARCLALRYLARFDEAGSCYADTTQRLHALGESLELAVTSLDFGTIELDRGRLASAIDLFERSRLLAAESHADDETGRAEFYLADAHARAGRPAEALTHLQAAMTRFERAGSGRWLGSSLLRLGNLLGELGAIDDARAAVEAGLRHFDETNAPARVAGGQLALARIALRAGEGETARTAAERAHALYTKLAMPLEAGLAADLQLQARIAAQDVEKEEPARAAATGAITLAELDFARGDIAAAGARLGGLDETRLSLTERLRRQTLSARVLAANGGLDAALSALRAEAASWSRLARRAGSAVLRERIEGFNDELRVLAVDLLAQERLAGGVRPAAQIAEILLGLIEVPGEPGHRAAPGPQDWDALDQQLAAALFPGLGTGPAAAGAPQRALLDALRAAVPSKSADGERAARLDLDSLRSRLAPGDAALLVFEGRRHAISIRVADALSVHAIGERAALQGQVARLIDLAHRRDAPLTDLLDAAQAVSRALFAADMAAAQGGRTLVFATGSLADLPWPLLLDDGVAPGRRITALVPRASLPVAAPSWPDRIAMYIASQQGGATLAALDGAEREAGQVRAAVPALAIEEFPAATRADLLAGFAREAAWIHVAAHGTLAPGRIGGAGLWLDPAAAGEVPGYLSWLELLERGVAARVVVLDACQLGSDGAGGKGPLGFSHALLRAGAQHVVAAQWPLSDTASALWVKSFYRAAFERRAGLDAALAQARADLRNSRAFRHPYYWAGLTHFEALAP